MVLLTWLVPSARRPPPEIAEKPQRRASRVQRQEPPRPKPIYNKAESVPRPEPVRHVSFNEQAPVPSSPAPVSAPSSPRGRPIPLPRCRSRTVQSGAVSPPPARASLTLDNSPLSSAETLTEAPTETKRVFAARLTRVLPWGRPSTIGTTSSSSSSDPVICEKAETRPNVTQRGKFGFLKKSRTIDVRIRPGMIGLIGLFVFNLTLFSQLSVRVAVLVGPLPCPSLHTDHSHQISFHLRIR